MPTTVTSQLMRSINYANTLKLIRQSGPVSRTEIANLLGASLSTIVRIVDELLDDDLVCVSGEFERTAGRSRPLIEFNGAAHTVIGVDLGEEEMLGAVSDLSGNILREVKKPIPSPSKLNDASYVIDLLTELLEFTDTSDKQMRGIAIGAPGATQGREGIVTWAPSLNWRDFPLKDTLSQHFDVPIFVENDVNLLALGEWGFGANKDLDDLICVFIGTGIGAGLIIGGALHRGFHQASGEVGRSLTGVQCLDQHYDDQYGPLEQEASKHAIMNHAKANLGNAPITLKSVFEAAAENNEWAISSVRNALDYLSLAIAHLSCIVDPEVIVLGGSVTEYMQPYLPDMCERLERSIPVVPRIEISTLGRHSVVLGAAMLILSSTLESYVLKQFA
jgi:glucokinase